MAISSKTAAALIGGGTQAKGKTMKIKVLRNFLIAGEVQKTGQVIDVPNALGQELIFANKAEKAAEGKAKAEKSITKEQDDEPV